MTRMKEQQQQHQRYETRTIHQGHQDHNMLDSDGGQSDSDFDLPMTKKLLAHHQLLKTFWSKHKPTTPLEKTTL